MLSMTNPPVIKAAPLPIAWHPDLSIYASEAFLQSVGDEYGWLGGFDAAGTLRCILPYTIVRKAMLRMARFRVETIILSGGLSVAEEKAFLNSAMGFLRSTRADMVIPAATNTLFRTYPDRAVAAPYGSYVVDLTQPEETLWNNLHSKHRNVIRNAIKKGVSICEGEAYLLPAYELIRETLKRSQLGFMSLEAFRRSLVALGDNVKLLVASSDGNLHGCAVIPFSRHSAYYLYGGSASSPLSGASNLLQWEAMRRFRQLGVRRYDFVGVRINPEKGSKQDGLMLFKERFGGQLMPGYLWKCSFHPLQFFLYNLAVRLRRGGDIVDQERHKLNKTADSTAAGPAPKALDPTPKPRVLVPKNYSLPPKHLGD